jgi:polyisoprenoid-binding protein YceI
MKNIAIILGLLICYSATAQQYVDKAGKAHFFSATSMENIEATSHSVICALNISNKKVIVKIKNKSFKFKSGLMEEHFNENYMESEKYEYSTLEGNITDNIDLTKDGAYDVNIKGALDIHGVKVERDIKAKLVVKNGAPSEGSSKFDVKLADHKIKIPSVVGANIAEQIAVDVEFHFEKYEKK